MFKNYLQKSKILRKTTLLLTLLTFINVNNEERFLGISKIIENCASLVNEIEKNYFEEVDLEEINEKVIKTILDQTDEYTRIITPIDSSFKEQNEIEENKFYGFEIEEIDEKKYFYKIYRNSPAFKAGLRLWDQIIKINNVDVSKKSLEEIIKIIKKTKKALLLTIQRPQLTSPIEISIKKENFEFKNILSTIINNQVAYIQITEFRKGVSDEFRETLEKQRKTGATRLIIDLRGNEGGLIDEAILIISELIDSEKTILKSISKRGEILKEYKTKLKNFDSKLPIAILVDEKTASTAEIFCGVLQYFDRAVIIGLNTFGKGTIQTSKDLLYGNKIFLTTATYIFNNGRSIHISSKETKNNKNKQYKTKGGRNFLDQRGISPDIYINQKLESKIIEKIKNLRLIEEYSAIYRQKRGERKTSTDQLLTEVEYSDFIKWMLKKENIFSIDDAIKNLEKEMKTDEIDTNLHKQIDQMKEVIKKSKEINLAANKKELKKQIEKKIVEQYLGYEGFIEANFIEDLWIQSALKTLENINEYTRILEKNTA